MTFTTLRDLLNLYKKKYFNLKVVNILQVSVQQQCVTMMNLNYIIVCHVFDEHVVCCAQQVSYIIHASDDSEKVTCEAMNILYNGCQR